MFQWVMLLFSEFPLDSAGFSQTHCTVSEARKTHAIRRKCSLWRVIKWCLLLPALTRLSAGCTPLNSAAHLSLVPDPGCNYFQRRAILFHLAFQDSAREFVQPKLRCSNTTSDECSRNISTNANLLAILHDKCCSSSHW